MHSLVTGAAGFIGSTLAERLLDDGWSVSAVDALTPYYEPARKIANLATIREHARGIAPQVAWHEGSIP
jgi:UDP-glucuronate 4-epimerase